MKISSDMKTWKHARLFLDTSALVKLLAPELEEPGTKELENYLQIGIRLHTSNYCIGETLGVLKAKWLRKELTTDDYLIVIDRLNWKIDNNRIVLHQLSPSNKSGDLIRFVHHYGIDYVDAMLLNYAIRSEQHDLFVTADSGLFKAAEEFGLKCWNIVKSSEPPD